MLAKKVGKICKGNVRRVGKILVAYGIKILATNQAKTKIL
jgi:hypothetical protein